MSAATDFAAAAQALAEGVRAAAGADAVRVLIALAGEPTADPAGAMLRRAALVSLARATAESSPGSYDEAVALRDTVCGLLEADAVVAADAGQDRTAEALNGLRVAVAADLDARGAALSPLRTVTLAQPVPALVAAQRLYGDAKRADGLLRQAGAPANPVFMAGAFRASAR